MGGLYPTSLNLNRQGTTGTTRLTARLDHKHYKAHCKAVTWAAYIQPHSTLPYKGPKHNKPHCKAVPHALQCSLQGCDMGGLCPIQSQPTMPYRHNKVHCKAVTWAAYIQPHSTSTYKAPKALQGELQGFDMGSLYPNSLRLNLQSPTDATRLTARLYNKHCSEASCAVVLYTVTFNEVGYKPPMSQPCSGPCSACGTALQ